ncbi:uncharacterized protein [Neodiprion pinetum]|uniref:uncharacterized protein n=1 Tax=Neodiprion pinetum TaxID=441929 RepID=UPI00371617AB
MPAAGHPFDVDNDVESTTDHLRESGPSGTPSNHSEQHAPPLYHQLSHDCEGPRCLCQRYENGELAAAVLNQNRNPNELRDYENHQNLGRGHRRPTQSHPNLNPNYQNPIDFIANDNHATGRRGGSGHDRDRRHYEPEENIYERLDEVQGCREGDHTYERIDDRAWHRRARYRTSGPQNVAGPSDVYVDSRRITGPSCLSRLGRNCFSTENIASASNRRYVYQLGQNCTCQFCRHLDARAVCQYCNNFHDKLRYQDPGTLPNLAGSRHYIYQLSRSCRCALCRDDSLYTRFPINSRLSDSFRRDCHCRNPGTCSCRNRFLSYSNPAIYIGRINHAVNNPLYATPVGILDPNPSTSSGAQGLGEPSTSTGRTSGNYASSNPSSSGVPACSGNRSSDRQHVCDDSCIRNPNVGGVYQILGKCERADCHHGRVSIHWVFVNKWVPSWSAQDSVPEADANPEPASRDDEPRNQPEGDADES